MRMNSEKNQALEMELEAINKVRISKTIVLENLSVAGNSYADVHQNKVIDLTGLDQLTSEIECILTEE